MPIYALGPDEPQIHPSCFVHPDAVVIGRVSIGEEATIWPGAVLRGDHGGRIEVGARTSIQDGTVLHTTEQWPTVIGPECVVGHNAHLEGCTVESRCLIGSGSITLNRAVVRTGAVVGAAALVPEDFEVPARTTAVGVPVHLRKTGLDPSWMDFAVQSYVDAGNHYRGALRRFDR
ncbi:gamma carbonic anhydrase family protein [Streptomyces sp. RB6PN25]|uniref:Gamma carbonic anhydrase family protein n=1 Tax=Streptomyces humicola TaxID=2953240 RepID=A0ABT1PSZ4_9ACTN|nr:gamma carbonic anhydrase family protein [Streptomyces humicola]MCQ4080792.1 gamma carbonic anhydrase family protein [Streptomyces humicola]